VPDQSPARIADGLHDLARALREGPQLGPEAQNALAELIDELGAAVSTNAAPPAEVVHVAETTALLVKALKQRHETTGLATARDRFEGAVIRAEATAPVTAGVARRVLDALANLGI
jgi:hypothetical protein